MNCTVSEESLAALGSYWSDTRQSLNWSSVFVLPAWQRVWWQVFGQGYEPFVRVVRSGENIIGIAPLMVREGTVHLIGDTDVCDYLDFIVCPGMEANFFAAIVQDLKENNVKHLDLRHVRSDSTVFKHLIPFARGLGFDISSSHEDVTVEMNLPVTWDDYLAALSSKQRHEVRRKLRRLSEAGEINYRFIEEDTAIPDAMDLFFKMFTESRRDKADFLTGQMQEYFKLLAGTMAGEGFLKLGILELDTTPVAEIMCFDYNDCVYLYNSGYDPGYDYLSVGLLSKVLAIKDSIEHGRKRFDFLKGAEIYKSRLGGMEVLLYSCQITIK